MALARGVRGSDLGSPGSDCEPREGLGDGNMRPLERPNEACHGLARREGMRVAMQYTQLEWPAVMPICHARRTW